MVPVTSCIDFRRRRTGSRRDLRQGMGSGMPPRNGAVWSVNWSVHPMLGRVRIPSVGGVAISPTKGRTMRIRIVTFAIDIPADGYIRQATDIAPAFGAWPGLLAKWWLGD